MTSTSLSLHWERMKRLAICSFGIKKLDFPKIKFSSNKQGIEENVSAIKKDQYLKTTNLLYEKANMKMHYSFISCGHLHLDQMRCSHWDLKILKTRMDKNLFCITQTRRIKGRSLLSMKNFMPKLWTLKRWK